MTDKAHEEYKDFCPKASDPCEGLVELLAMVPGSPGPEMTVVLILELGHHSKVGFSICV